MKRATVELAIIAAAYIAYAAVRVLVSEDVDQAFTNAVRVMSWESSLHIACEASVQLAALRSLPLTHLLNAFYALAYWPTLVLSLVYLFARRRDLYRRLRTALIVSGLAGLVFFALFPLAPPRFAEARIVDTISRYDPGLHEKARPSRLTNQYAAMPSFHFGWTLIATVCVGASLRRRRSRLLIGMLPLTMGLAVIATGNHYVVDVIVGGGLSLFALLLSTAPRTIVGFRQPPLGALRPPYTPNATVAWNDRRGCSHHFVRAATQGERPMTTTAERPREGLDPSASGAPPVVLSTRGLTKEFGGNTAVDHLDLTVHEGEVFGFLGPNGAGKTTTLRLILGLIYASSGEVEVLGHRVPQERREALRHVGGFVETPAFYHNMSARRNLRLLGRLNGVRDERRIEEVLDAVGLFQRADSKVGDYSQGMKQRLGIANALLHRPSLIILDEPTSGLDPQGMKGVRELIAGLAGGGTTIVLSSHLLNEVEQVCDRAVIINKGRVVVQGPVGELRPASSKVKLLTSDQTRSQVVIASLLGPDAVAADDGHLVVESSEEQVREMVARLVGEGIGIDAVVPAREQGLEDYFLGLTESSEMAGAALLDNEAGAR